jgi:hypothetical protein
MSVDKWQTLKKIKMNKNSLQMNEVEVIEC